MTRRQTKRAVVYARIVSPARSGHGSIDHQLAACLRMADRLGATVSEEFTDYGVSGLNLEVPVLTRLFDYVESHPTDYVICADMARVTGKHEVSLEASSRLSQHGARVVLADLDAVLDRKLGDPNDADTKTEQTA